MCTYEALRKHLERLYVIGPKFLKPIIIQRLLPSSQADWRVPSHRRYPCRRCTIKEATQLGTQSRRRKGVTWQMTCPLAPVLPCNLTLEAAACTTGWPARCRVCCCPPPPLLSDLQFPLMLSKLHSVLHETPTFTCHNCPNGLVRCDPMSLAKPPSLLSNSASWTSKPSDLVGV